MSITVFQRYHYLIKSLGKIPQIALIQPDLTDNTPLILSLQTTNDILQTVFNGNLNTLKIKQNVSFCRQNQLKIGDITEISTKQKDFWLRNASYFLASFLMLES